MPIIAVGLSHRSAPVTVRERFAFAEAAIPDALQKIRDLGMASEAVILSTCNRVEIYASSDLPENKAFGVLQNFLIEHHDYRDEITTEIYTLGEPRSIEHLFKVACGLDSMVLGETEILGQLKKAYEIALQHKHTGSRLNKAFQKAFNAAKQVRTETNIQRGNVSVASVAVDLAEKIFSALDDRQVIVIGAHSIIVSNRSHERAVALARELDGRAVHFEEWGREFAKIDIIISSTSAPHYVW